MGEYERWNPLFKVLVGSPKSLEQFKSSVDTAFVELGARVSDLADGYNDEPAWQISSSSPVIENGESDENGLEERVDDFRRQSSSSETKFLRWLAGSKPRFWGWLSSRPEKTTDHKLVVSFRVPRVTPEMVRQLEELYLDMGFARNREEIANDIDLGQPYPHIASDLERDMARSAGRITNKPDYADPTNPAIWFSTKKNGRSHWLYGADDVLVELRTEPKQNYLKFAEYVVRMASILTEQEYDSTAAFVSLWHSVIDEHIEPVLLRSRMTPSQERIYRSMLIATAFPFFHEEYAQAHGYRPYNSLLLAPRGTGKSLLAAKLATTRFDSGVIVPMSLDVLMGYTADVLGRLTEAHERTGVQILPLVEDLDGAARPGLGSDFANALAGMGAEKPVVMGTGYLRNDLDANMMELERLGGNLLHLDLPDYDERQQLADYLLGEKGVDGKARTELAAQLARGSEGFSQRMIADAVNRTIIIAAERRIAVSPTDQDFVNVKETIDANTITAALKYADQHYSFQTLRSNAETIRSLFDVLGRSADERFRAVGDHSFYEWDDPMNQGK